MLSLCNKVVTALENNQLDKFEDIHRLDEIIPENQELSPQALTLHLFNQNFRP